MTSYLLLPTTQVLLPKPCVSPCREESFERALNLATNDLQFADIWFNLGHVALGVGDSSLAYQCFRLSLVHNNDSGEAYNNLGVLEMAHNRNELVI